MQTRWAWLHDPQGPGCIVKLNERMCIHIGVVSENRSGCGTPCDTRMSSNATTSDGTKQGVLRRVRRSIQAVAEITVPRAFPVVDEVAEVLGFVKMSNVIKPEDIHSQACSMPHFTTKAGEAGTQSVSCWRFSLQAWHASECTAQSHMEVYEDSGPLI